MATYSPIVTRCLFSRSRVSAKQVGTVNKRPISITVIAVIFLAAGTIGLVYHASEFNTKGPFQFDVLWVCLVRLMAILGGLFMLRASNWARWLLVIWLVYHVILSAFHSLSQVIVHSLLLAVITWFLFRPRASAYFRNS